MYLGVMNTATHPVRLARLAIGFRLEDLAHFSGVSVAVLSRLERNEINTTRRRKVAISRALGVPVAVLFPDDGADL